MIQRDNLINLKLWGRSQALTVFKIGGMTKNLNNRFRFLTLLAVPPLVYLFILKLPTLFPQMFDRLTDSWSPSDLTFPTLLFLYIPFVLVFIQHYGKLRLREIGLIYSVGRRPLRYWVCVMIIVFVVIVLSIIVTANIFRYYGLTLRFISETPGVINIYYFIMPIHEEIIFRGIMCTSLATKLNWRWAIFISGTLFGAAHLLHDIHDIQYMMMATFIGYFLGWVYFKSRTLLMPMACHLGLNVVILFSTVDPSVFDWFVGLVTFL